MANREFQVTLERPLGLLSFEFTLILTTFTLHTSLTAQFRQYGDVLEGTFFFSNTYIPAGLLFTSLLVNLLSRILLLKYRMVAEDGGSGRTLRAMAAARVFLALGTTVYIVLMIMFGGIDKTEFSRHFASYAPYSVNHGGPGKQVNKLQYQQKCCGHTPKTNDSGVLLHVGKPSPRDLWFTHFAYEDGAFPEQLLRNLTVPWSCCNPSSTKCGHVGFERFAQKYTRESYSEQQFEEGLKDWYMVPYEKHQELFSELAGGVTNADCVDTVIDDTIWHVLTPCLIAMGVLALVELSMGVTLIRAVYKVKRLLDEGVTWKQVLFPGASAHNLDESVEGDRQDTQSGDSGPADQGVASGMTVVSTDSKAVTESADKQKSNKSHKSTKSKKGGKDKSHKSKKTTTNPVGPSLA